MGVVNSGNDESVNGVDYVHADVTAMGQNGCLRRLMDITKTARVCVKLVILYMGLMEMVFMQIRANVFLPPHGRFRRFCDNGRPGFEDQCWVSG